MQTTTVIVLILTVAAVALAGWTLGSTPLGQFLLFALALHLSTLLALAYLFRELSDKIIQHTLHTRNHPDPNSDAYQGWGNPNNRWNH